MAKSSLSSLVPLLILLFVIVIGGVIGFIVYQIANDVADKTAKKMEKHNVSFGPEGIKVGVKSRSAEEVGDRTQSMLVKVWNHSYFPAYKSRLGWLQSKDESSATTSGAGSAQRQPYVRSSSSQSGKRA